MRKIMRNKITTALMAISAVCLLGGVGITAKTAYADGTTATVDEVAFTMQNGASVRLSQDGKNGLRYGITMSEADYTKLMNNVGTGKAYSALSFGILLAPASYETATVTLREDTFGGDEAFYWAEKNDQGNWVVPSGTVTTGKKQIMNFESPLMVEDENNADMMRYYGSMVGVKDANRAVDFVGVGYIKYVEGDTTKYVYTVENDNTRSIALVASKAIISDAADDTVDYSAYNTQLTHYVKGALNGESLAFVDAPTSVAEREVQLSLNTTAPLNVEWSTSDENVATVDAEGKVTATGYGDVTVYAKIGNLFSAQTTIIFEDNRPKNDTMDDLLIPQIMTQSNHSSYGDVNARTAVTPTVKQYGGDDALALTAKPEDLTTSSYVEYSVTQSSNGPLASGNYFGYAFVYREKGSSYPGSEEFRGQFSGVTDWSKAKLGFWVYNDTDYAFTLKSTAGNSVTADIKETITVATKKGWEYVEFDLSKFGYTSNPFASLDTTATGDELRIVFGFTSTGVTTTNATFNPKFYIDGFSIYNTVENDTMDDLLIPQIMTQSNHSSYGDANARTAVTPSVKQYGGDDALALTAKPEDLTTSSYVEYSVTQSSNGPLASGNYFGYAFVYREKGSSYPGSEEFRGQFSGVTDWSKAKLGFWVYNDTDYAFTLKSTAGNSVTADIKETITVETKKGWEYVEFDLSKFGYTSNPFASLDTTATGDELRIVFGFTSTGVTTTNATFNPKFYIDGFNIYN